MENRDVTWKDIYEANCDIKTTKLPAKKKNDKGEWVRVFSDYVEVKERVIAFRKIYPDGCIDTTIDYEDNYVLCTAAVYSNEYNNKLLAKGHARELLTKDFAVENAETSAIGRALGFCGLGIATSIASAEEIEKTESPSGVFDELPNKQPNKGLKETADDFRRIVPKDIQDKILHDLGLSRAEDLGMKNLQKYIDHYG